MRVVGGFGDVDVDVVEFGCFLVEFSQSCGRWERGGEVDVRLWGSGRPLESVRLRLLCVW